MNSSQDKAEHILYKTYWSIMLSDILRKSGLDATDKNKEELHEKHKELFGVKSIANMSHDRLSRFLLEVIIHWGERGIFVRTNRKQFIGIEDRGFSDIIKLPDGTKKRVWDLL